MRAGDAQEAVGDGAPGVTGRGDEDIDIALLCEMPQETGHEAGTDVLECKRRPMEEFQGINSFFHRHGRAVEGEGFRDDAVEFRAGNIFAEESRGDLLSDFYERKLGETADPIGGKSWDPFRHIEPAIFRKTLYDSLLQRSVWRLVFRTVILHVNRRSDARPGWKP